MSMSNKLSDLRSREEELSQTLSRLLHTIPSSPSKVEPLEAAIVAVEIERRRNRFEQQLLLNEAAMSEERHRTHWMNIEAAAPGGYRDPENAVHVEALSTAEARLLADLRPHADPAHRKEQDRLKKSILQGRACRVNRWRIGEMSALNS